MLEGEIKMYTLIIGIFLLCIAYVTYGKFIEKNFQIDPDRVTPAEALRDDLDFVPMSAKKNAIIELLNIAGTGPIFGPILGALYGPIAYLWIIVGCIFAGAVHDYMIGMISLRNDGAQLPALASKYIGKASKHIVNIFAMLLLMLVGTVFVVSPATLIHQKLPTGSPLIIVILGIFIYYIVSTILPIDKAMGKVYPWFGAILITSTIAIGFQLFMNHGAQIPELTPQALNVVHPDKLSLFPGIFFTISCGALSGFHATQSPLVSRTTKNEKEGRFIFYGMMLAEGVIAMIWLAASMTLFDGQTLSQLIAEGTPSLVVDKVTLMLLGSTFGTLAITGVIVLPLSSGLSAFRSLRIILADYLNIKQDTLKKILSVTIPLYVISFALTYVDFNILWRYFNWANQVTAVIALLVATRYLYLQSRNYIVTLIPSIFMLFAVVMYILSEPIGLRMGVTGISLMIGLIITLIMIVMFMRSGSQQKKSLPPESHTPKNTTVMHSQTESLQEA